MDPLLLVVGWFAGIALLWRVPVLRASAATEDSSPAEASRSAEVAVVIPARNEAANLPVLLRSIAAGDVVPSELVVVDDGSTDGTAAVAAAHGARVVSAPPPPPGWVGKSWACTVGASSTGAERLVFLDADVTLASSALRALCEEHDRVGGLVSVQPAHRLERPDESLSAFPAVVSMMGVGAAAIRPPRSVPAAFGPCMVTWRRDYDAVGGHRAVRGELVEDVALGRRYHRSGHAVQVLGGGDLLTFRMYPAGLGQLVEGWSKNMATGASAVPVHRSLGVALWIASALIAVILLARALAGDGSLLVASLAYAAHAWQLRRSLAQLGAFPLAASLLYPLALAGFLALFARSIVWTHVLRRATWRGRTVELRPSIEVGTP